MVDERNMAVGWWTNHLRGGRMSANRNVAARDLIAAHLPTKWPWDATAAAEVIVLGLWDSGFAIVSRERLGEKVWWCDDIEAPVSQEYCLPWEEDHEDCGFVVIVPVDRG